MEIVLYSFEVFCNSEQILSTIFVYASIANLYFVYVFCKRPKNCYSDHLKV